MRFEPLKILLVEDKDSLRQMLSTAIQKAGYTVDEAADGDVAAEKIRKQPYQLVITDLRLPTLSGLEILKIQKEIDPTIPVLLMTAYGTIEEAVDAMKQGAFDFVPKPIDISHLMLLDRSRSRPAAPAHGEHFVEGRISAGIWNSQNHR